MSWDEVAEQFRPLPVINPEVKEMGDRDAFLWSLSESIALALVTRIDRMENPIAFLGRSVALLGAGCRMSVPAANDDREKCANVAARLRAGWTVSLREGTDLRDLLSKAFKRMEDGFAAHKLEGVAG